MFARSQTWLSSFQLYTQEWLPASFCEICSAVKSGFATGASHFASVVFKVQDGNGLGPVKKSWSGCQIQPIPAKCFLKVEL